MQFYFLIGINLTTLFVLIGSIYKIGRMIGEIETKLNMHEHAINNLPCIKKPDEYFSRRI